MYDPTTARFLQEDTYTGDPNDPLSLNLYTYCHNEPIMYTDPSGNTPIWIRDITAEYGGKVTWDTKTKTAYVTIKNQTIGFQGKLFDGQMYVDDDVFQYQFGFKQAKSMADVVTAATRQQNMTKAEVDQWKEYVKYASDYYNAAQAYYNDRSKNDLFQIPYKNTVSAYLPAVDYWVKTGLIRKNSPQYKVAIANVYFNSYTDTDIVGEHYRKINDSVDMAILGIAIANLKRVPEYHSTATIVPEGDYVIRPTNKAPDIKPTTQNIPSSSDGWTIQTENYTGKANLPQQGKVKGNVEGAPPVDAGKQGKHVSGHKNNNPSSSQWPQGLDGVDLTQKAWQNGKTLPDGTGNGILKVNQSGSLHYRAAI